MNLLDNYVYFYSYLYNRKGIHPFVFTPFRRLIRYVAKFKIPKYLKTTTIQYSAHRSDVIVSLTSFPERINQVYQVIHCMLRQTILPKKIILWLSKDQFIGSSLPSNLVSLENEIFTIRMVDGDIRSHKKYYYALKEYPDNYILLIDDDLYYPSDMIELLLKEAQLHPNSVICRYGSIPQFDDNNEMLPYNSWWNELIDSSSNPNLFLGTGGGTLLKKSLLYPAVVDLDLALKLTPFADDIWINAMINLAQTAKYKIRFGEIFPIDNTQQVRLSKNNVSYNQNDVQLKNIIDYFKNSLGVNPFSYRV